MAKQGNFWEYSIHTGPLQASSVSICSCVGIWSTLPQEVQENSMGAELPSGYGLQAVVSSDTMCKVCKIIIASNKQERKSAHTSRSYTNAQAASHARPLSHCYQVRLSVNIGRWVSTFRIDERHSESPRDGSLLCRYQQRTASSVGRRQLPYGVVNEPRQTDASHQLHDLCRAPVLASACMHNTSTYWIV